MIPKSSHGDPAAVTTTSGGKVPAPKDPVPDVACACGAALYVQGMFRERLLEAFRAWHVGPDCSRVKRPPKQRGDPR